MNYEEKYNDLLSRIKRMADVQPDVTRVAIESLFPELIESEEERIRKELLNYLYDVHDDDEERASWMAWLEKKGEQNLPIEKLPLEMKTVSESLGFTTQKECDDYDKMVTDLIMSDEGKGEQKPADKVEPKFHKGEWLCENEPNNYARFIQILEIVNVQGKERYRISRDIHEDEDVVEFGFVNKYYHKFDIKDAKDGNVLYAKGSYFKKYLFMFSSLTEDNVISTHFGYDVFHGTFDKKLTRFGRKEDFMSVTPATKEQRDLLFQKIKEAGYVWDAEKKELKKEKVDNLHNYLYGEQKTAEWSSEQSKTLQTDDVPNESSTAAPLRTGAIGFDGKPIESKPCEQNPTWSEEDELHIRELESIVKQVWATAEHENDKDTIHKMSDLSFFLKTLKPQLKQEWSEEDKNRINRLIAYFEDKESFTAEDDIVYANWLKSIKDRYTWKPSDEQMEALSDINLTGGISYAGQGQELINLYNDLKNLTK